MPPVFNEEKCKKCRKCVTRCPGYLLEMGEKIPQVKFPEECWANMTPSALKCRCIHGCKTYSDSLINTLTQRQTRAVCFCRIGQNSPRPQNFRTQLCIFSDSLPQEHTRRTVLPYRYGLKRDIPHKTRRMTQTAKLFCIFLTILFYLNRLVNTIRGRSTIA